MNVSLLFVPTSYPTILSEAERAAFSANPKVAVAGLPPREGHISTILLTPTMQAGLWMERWIDSIQPAPTVGEIIFFQTGDGLSPWRVVKTLPGCTVVQPLKVVAS